MMVPEGWNFPDLHSCVTLGSSCRRINGAFETRFPPIVLLSESPVCDFTVKYEVCG